MKKYIKLFFAFRKIQLMKMIEYRSDFFFWMFVSLMWTVFNYFFFGLIFSQGKGIEGWNYNQILLLISFFTMIDALTWSVFWPNMSEFTKEIFNGELSKYLVLPVNSIYLILTQHASYHNVPRFLVGFVVMIHAINQLNLSISITQIVLAIIVFGFGIILLYSCWFILATCSFWVERLQNINDIMPQFNTVYKVPVQVYTGISGIIFSFVIPLGLITTLPSEIILGTENKFFILYFIFASSLFFLISIGFFKISIKKYSSVGG
jgi:ABC-2 type transport system permease protein